MIRYPGVGGGFAGQIRVLGLPMGLPRPDFGHFRGVAGDLKNGVSGRHFRRLPGDRIPLYLWCGSSDTRGA